VRAAAAVLLLLLLLLAAYGVFMMIALLFTNQCHLQAFAGQVMYACKCMLCIQIALISLLI